MCKRKNAYRCYRLVALVLAIGLAGAFGATGCFGKVLKADGAEKVVVDVVSRQTGFKPINVKCPSGINAKVGAKFKCRFKGPGGKRYEADLRVTAIKGERVDYYVSTREAR